MSMFEFGRDLRKLFAQAREYEDLGWIELIGTDLLHAEARRESVDAGRVSCAKPFDAERRAAGLWREHARRTGHSDSLDRADRASTALVRLAQGEDQTAIAAVDRALGLMLRFDLCGDPSHLDNALTILLGVGYPRKVRTAGIVASAHARVRARLSRLSGNVTSLLDAAALMDAGLHGAGIEDVELRLDRAALTLEAGILKRDARLLDQAGRDLRALIELAPADRRPLTRARALVLCATGLGALANVAQDKEALAHGRLLFDAASELFTPDHSPLDWVTIQLVRADEDAVPLMVLSQAEALSSGQGLVIGALARERRAARETELAETIRDLAALMTLEQRLYDHMAHAAPLDWAADQIAIAGVRLAKARLGGGEPHGLGMILAEAAVTALEMGAPVLADRAEALRCVVATGV